MVAESSGEACESEYSISPVCKVELEFLALLGCCAVLLLVFLLFFGCLLVFSGEKFCDFIVFLLSEEFAHCLRVEEHDIYVIFCAPAAVASVTVSV